ncbi:MAG TPA: M15 family metallopeptidase [Gemmatimonadaceae bacterium]|jgi:D-alanyl-D-alanine dipeptidase
MATMMCMRRSLGTSAVRLFCVTATIAAIASPAAAQQSAPRTVTKADMPPTPPAALVGLIGEYDAPAGVRLVLEDSGKLYFADTLHHRVALTQRSISAFGVDRASAEQILGSAGSEVTFARSADDRATSAKIGTTTLKRLAVGPQPGTNQLRIKPLRPVAELRAEALTQSPPAERGPFKPADLVELTKLDPTIKLEIRYATTNNFLGTKFYDEARAFMQRPAAEAVVRANKALRAEGWGLLIHDAYRPWYVTKMFWDATPPDKRWLVANPAKGSLHNRGAAVDLTLFDLATGKPVDMPSTYDESTDRAHADYPGGTTRERWLRAVLRRAMEAQGFTVNPDEWWHFDYKDWRDYAIGNVAFDKIGK